MLFNSLAFLIFLPVVLLVYYRLNLKGQNLWLLAASWFFYGWWDYRFLILLALSTTVDFFCSQKIFASKDPRTRKTFLLVSIITNLSILGFFKYFNFFVDSFIGLLGSVGLDGSSPVLHIILPMGISFYTFQTMAYTIDIYRGRQEPTRSFTNFALYVSFFPQLVAGPIERASALLPQLENKRRVSSDQISQGLILILLGFFKKMALADPAAMVVNQVFTDPEHYYSPELLLGVYLFAVQIYCDFSGYTDIARGVSKLLGVELMINFEHPYFSTSITEFWRRWHISLSTWLRDYLYIPLGGNRHGQWNTYRNLMLTMLLGGLWHGASWNFVIWGGLNGLYLSLERIFRSDRQVTPAGSRVLQEGQSSRNMEPVEPRALGISSVLGGRIRPIWRGVLTFHLVCLTWIFFRSTDFGLTLDYLGGFLSIPTEWTLHLDPYQIIRLAPALLLLVWIDINQYRLGDHTFLRNRSVIFQAGIFMVLILLIIVFGAFDEEVPFIYFQF